MNENEDATTASFIHSPRRHATSSIATFYSLLGDDFDAYSNSRACESVSRGTVQASRLRSSGASASCSSGGYLPAGSVEPRTGRHTCPAADASLAVFEGLSEYTFHWNLFEDYTFKTYCNWIDSQIIREWYDNGPLKHVGKDCLEALLGEVAALPEGTVREAKRSQEEYIALTGDIAPIENDIIHKIKRGDVKLDSMSNEDWDRLSSSLRMPDDATY